MIIDAKAAKWGYGFLIAAVVFFLLYWFILLEPVQAAAIAKGKTPSVLLYIVIGMLFGGLFGVLTSVGFALTKPKWFGITYEAKIGDLVNNKGVRTWVIISMALFAFVTAFLPSNV